MYANLKLAPHLAAVFFKSMWFSDVNMIVISFYFYCTEVVFTHFYSNKICNLVT